MSELHELSAVRQAELIAAGELTAPELLEHYLARVERLDHEVGAFITVTEDLARAQAAESQRRADRARRGEGRIGPLHGVPVPVKDSVHVAGVPTSFASAAVIPHPAARDDHVVGRLRRAGTVMIGKTNLSEFELSGHCENRIAPPARTPWDPRRSAGGSSGGAAAAVAAGLSPLAHGSDSAGSVRGPASACGLVGFKPSRGLVPGGPTSYDVSGLTTSGALARTVADAAALLDVLTTDTAGAPVWRARPESDGTFCGHAARVPRRLRVALVEHAAVPGVEVDAECRAAAANAAALLDRLGHRVEPARLLADGALGRAFPVVWSVLTAARAVAPEHEDELMPLTRFLRAQGRRHDGVAFAEALREFRAIATRTAAHFAAYDVVLTPTLAAPPLPVGHLRNEADPAAESAATVAFSPFTCLYNVTGQPAVSLPLHWSAEGLPIGVMLAAPRGDDALLISLAAQLEREQPWSGRRPGIW
ncbi:amidase [Streptomyces griseofuscus]|uniref:amidase n=1 Tax=Streptomyces TaxID=1883 RepID=UPI0018F08438|nr:amidase [Streptomyces sp. CRPSP2-6A1]MBJ6999473.1 amidase [Streptomyces sp. CRPSP2-6A1]